MPKICMNRKMIFSSVCLAAQLFATENLSVVEHSIEFKFVDASKSDTNRIICENGDFGKLIYSKDKELTLQKDGSNAFLKLSPVITKSNGIVINSKVNEFTRDAYLECDSKIYSINFIPKDIPAQTIVLMDKAKDKTKSINPKAKEFEKANDFEKTMIDMIKSTYKEIPPEGYSIEYKNDVVMNFDELELKNTKKYIGSGYVVDEYLITTKMKVEIDEKMFVPYIAKNPLAIALTDLLLDENKQARLLVVSNANPDPITEDVKKKNFYKSLEDYNKKDKEVKEEFNSKNTVSKDVLDFIGNDK